MLCHFFARQYQMHFPEWKFFDFDEYFTEMCSPGSKILFPWKPLKDVASQASYYQCHVIQTQNCVFASPITHDDVIKWKHYPRYWPSVRRNSPVTDEFPTQRPVTRSFDVFFDLCLNKWLNKPLRRRWFETPWCSLWCPCNGHGSLDYCVPFCCHYLRVLVPLGPLVNFTWGSNDRQHCMICNVFLWR